MKKFVALLAKEKRKTATTELENDGSDIIELHIVYIKNSDNSLSILTR